MKLSVIIPVYNEVATLSTVVEAVRTVPLDKEIIVVDGNSTDGTREVLAREAGRGDVLAVFQTEKNGRGGALREGLKHAAGDVVVFQDADLELDPACFPQLLAPIERGDTDVVLLGREMLDDPNWVHHARRALDADEFAHWDVRHGHALSGRALALARLAESGQTPLTRFA